MLYSIFVIFFPEVGENSLTEGVTADAHHRSQRTITQAGCELHKYSQVEGSAVHNDGHKPTMATLGKNDFQRQIIFGMTLYNVINGAT